MPEIGLMLIQGDGVKQDISKGVEYFEKAAASGSPFSLVHHFLETL
jgi:TPR repeat protein